MTTPLAVRPVRFEPSMETIRDDEAETAREIADTMRGIAETTSKNYGRAVRTVHAKSHGLVAAEMTVLGGLAADYAQGVFQPGRAYPVVMRFSTNPGDILDDSVTVPRGLAIKVAGVEGERLPGSEDAATQDFVMANGPAFVAPDAKGFLKTLKLLAATTDTPQIFKKGLSAALRGVETAVEAVGGESGRLKALGGHPSTHILGESFFSQVPVLYGPFVAKIRVAPASPGLRELTDSHVATFRRPDALREAVAAFFQDNGGEWEVAVQLMTDPEAMPIEDASVVWPQDMSPYVPVARIRARSQDSWSAARVAAVDEAMAFSPWHGIAAHRPLGSIMRARRLSYETSAGFRAGFNRCPIHEPSRAEAESV